MSEKYLRNMVDGTIYDWHPILANNPKCEEVTEEEAYPERFVNSATVKKVRKRRASTNTKLDLTTTDIPDDPVYTLDELNEEASRGLPE